MITRFYKGPYLNGTQSHLKIISHFVHFCDIRKDYDVLVKKIQRIIKEIYVLMACSKAWIR